MKRSTEDEAGNQAGRVGRNSSRSSRRADGEDRRSDRRPEGSGPETRVSVVPSTFRTDSDQGIGTKLMGSQFSHGHMQEEGHEFLNPEGREYRMDSSARSRLEGFAPSGTSIVNASRTLLPRNQDRDMVTNASQTPSNDVMSELVHYEREFRNGETPYEAHGAYSNNAPSNLGFPFLDNEQMSTIRPINETGPIGNSMSSIHSLPNMLPRHPSYHRKGNFRDSGAASTNKSTNAFSRTGIRSVPVSSRNGRRSGQVSALKNDNRVDEKARPADPAIDPYGKQRKVHDNAHIAQSQEQSRGRSVNKSVGNMTSLGREGVTYSGAAASSSRAVISVEPAPHEDNSMGGGVHSSGLALRKLVDGIVVQPTSVKLPVKSAASSSGLPGRATKGKVVLSRKRIREENEQVGAQALRIRPEMTAEERHRIRAERNRRSAKESRDRQARLERQTEVDVWFGREVNERWKAGALKYQAVLQHAVQNIKDDNIDTKKKIAEALRDVEQTIRSCSWTFRGAEVKLIELDYLGPDEGVDEEEDEEE